MIGKIWKKLVKWNDASSINCASFEII